MTVHLYKLTSAVLVGVIEIGKGIALDESESPASSRIPSGGLDRR